MKTSWKILAGMAAMLGVIALFACAFVVREGQQAVVTQFGRPIRVVTNAGLHFRIPWIQEVNYLEKRLLAWDGAPENMQTRDKKRIFIDVWARWRIVDPMKFFQVVRTQQGGHKILDDLVDSAVRDVVARHNLIDAVRSTTSPLERTEDELPLPASSTDEVVTAGRDRIEALIVETASGDLEERYGMELSDVHIKRVSYVESVRQTVYERMRSERERVANLYRSEAIEEQNRIRGLTQKELDQIEGEMQQKSAEIRGAADAEVIALTAEAYSRAPDFFEFLQRLELSRKILGKETHLILTTDSNLLDFLKNFDDAPTVRRRTDSPPVSTAGGSGRAP